MTTRREFLGAAGLLLVPGMLPNLLTSQPQVVESISKRKLLLAIQVQIGVKKHRLTDWEPDEVRAMVADVHETYDYYRNGGVSHEGQEPYTLNNLYERLAKDIDVFLQLCAHADPSDFRQSRRPYTFDVMLARMSPQERAEYREKYSFSHGPA